MRFVLGGVGRTAWVVPSAGYLENTVGAATFMVGTVATVYLVARRESHYSHERWQWTAIKCKEHGTEAEVAGQRLILFKL